MPPERFSCDRKDFFKDRKHERSTHRWRESSSNHYGSSRDFSRWGGSSDFRKLPGHGKMGGCHLFREESGRGYPPFRSNDRIMDDKNYRPSISRGDGKYGRSSRDNRGSFSQRDWRHASWEMSNGCPNTPAMLYDASNDQRTADDMLTYPPSHSHSELVKTWDQLHSKDLHDNSKMNDVGTGQRGDRENSLELKPPKWTRSGSLSSRGSGFSHSSSSKSGGVGDSSERKVKLRLKNVPLEGGAVACVTSAPSDDLTSRKKPRLNWGEGLAKYEKKKVDGPEVNINKDGPVISSSNIEPICSQSSNLVDKSPTVMGLSDCASPATPTSVACSSPAVEEKTLGKGINADNDVNNLCGSPSLGSRSHDEGFSFNLEVVDANSISSLSSSLVEMLQYDDSSLADSSIVRSTLIIKLLVLKGDISKALEVTESEIDSLESELKSMKFESGCRYPCPAASSFLRAMDDSKLYSEQGAGSCDVPQPSPSQVLACGAGRVEKILLCGGVLKEVRGAIKDDHVDSAGTAILDFVEPVALVKIDTSSCVVKPDEFSGNTGAIQMPTMTLKPSNEEDIDVSGCRDVNMLIKSKEVASFSSDMSSTEDNLCNLILASNKESTARAYEVFHNLLPRDKCKIDFSEVTSAALQRNTALVKEKFAMRKRFLRFKERVVTLKFKAFQHLWREDMRLLSIRKCRAKSQKKYELSVRMTHSGYQKNRSSTRSRFSSPVGNSILVPTTEMLNFTSKLLSDSQNKLYRNALKMPVLILDKKERRISQFISSNGLVEDPCAVERERAMINPWTSEERKIFIDKLATFGKDFRKIASFLDHKTTADCVDFYYKNHKSDCFGKSKKSKQVKSSTNYLMASGKNWNRETNAGSLEILGAASLIAADADNAVGNQHLCSGRIYLGGYCDSKTSHGDDGNLDQSSNFDILENERETVAADVLAGICGSMSLEAMSSCITTSVHPVDSGREWKLQNVDSVQKWPSASDSAQNVDEETCSDESCEEMDPADWMDEEKSSFIRAVSSYGKDFAMISRCVRTRSRDECKVFFSKARKCLGLDSIYPGPGNLGTPESDDANGGPSDTEDGCAFEAGPVICSNMLGSMTDEDLPMRALDKKHEESDAVEKKNLTADLNKPKGNDEVRLLDQNDSKDEKTFIADVCKMECTSALAFDSDCKVLDGSVHRSEVVLAKEIQNESVSSEAESRKPIEDEISIRERICGDAVDPGTSDSVSVIEAKAVAEVAGNGTGNHLEQREHLIPENSLNSQSNLMQDSNATGNVSPLPLDMGSCSSFSLNVREDKSPVISLPEENNLATADSVLQESVVIQCERMHNQENRVEQGKNYVNGDDASQHLPGKSLFNCSESSLILRGYPLQIPTKREMNGDVSCRPLSEVQSLPTPANQFVGQDCRLQKCNSSNPWCSVPELPLLSRSSTEQSSDHLRDHCWSSSDMEKPSRNGDVKLFGKILTNPSSLRKLNTGVYESVEQESHCSKVGSKSSFIGHPTTDGSSSVLKFDSNNDLGLENVPVESYGFWDGKKIQTGFPSLPEYFLAKCPAALSNYHIFSSKMEHQALNAAVKCNDRNLNGISVLPPKEISISNGVVDCQLYRSRDSCKMQPPSVEMQQQSDIFSEMKRRNGFEAMSSLQQQGRGVVGMNVVGGGILARASFAGVSDPVAALKMHYAKTDQFNGATIVREEESWRNKGDIGR